MADKIFLNARYAFRSDTLDNWQSSNPVLEKGEPAVVTDGIDGEWLKIGDGVTPFNSLEWKKGPKGEQGLQGDKGEPGADGKDGKDAGGTTVLSALWGRASNVAYEQTKDLPQGSIIYVLQENNDGTILEGYPTADVFYKTGAVGEEGVCRLLTDRFLGNGLNIDANGGLLIEKETLIADAQLVTIPALNEAVNPTINEFTSPALETNKVYRFDITTSIAFYLPTDVDNAILNTIQLQVTISNYDAISIDLGTTKYFGDIPELGDGSYIIYYEHNGEDWCVGALEIIGA